jgi:hypothetical protein
MTTSWFDATWEHLNPRSGRVAGVRSEPGWFWFHQRCRRERRPATLAAWMAEPMYRSYFDSSAMFLALKGVNRRGLPFRRKPKPDVRPAGIEAALAVQIEQEKLTRRKYDGGKSIIMPLQYRKP